jgi:hypothetical protein
MYDYQERLERETAQTRTYLAEIEQQIAFHKTEIEKLSEIHRRLTAIERIVHPPEPGKPKKKASLDGMVAEETLDKTIEWLRANRPNVDIYVGALMEVEGWELSKSHTQKILALLHERGQLRLDSTGRGGRRNFRVVA